MTPFSKLTSLLTVLSVSFLLVNPGIGADKLTDRTHAAFLSASANDTLMCWLFLDDEARDSSPIVLSEKARSRRARVDPAGLLIDERDYPIKSQVVTAIGNTGARVRRSSRWLGAVSVEATAEQLVQLDRLAFVKRVDLVDVLISPVEPQTPRTLDKAARLKSAAFSYGSSYFQNRFVNAIKLHDAGLTGKGVLIALFDSGFDIYQRVFDSMSIIATWDFINDDTTVDEPECPLDPVPQNLHGTLVLSVIGGFLPDTLIGVAPDADYMLAKTEITCDGTEIKIEEDNWIAAAEWADSLGADIISSSLGYL
ncbi:MAG: S8 family serine peptidase, partial [Candidatus Zixiibacteriota bacterium]